LERGTRPLGRGGEVLDFYHASEHIWALGEAVYGQREAARPWVEAQLHQLRHGKQAAVLATIAALKARCARQNHSAGTNYLPNMPAA